jgi:multisubunit Na+/H+ antiporter MnhC subunit
MERSRWRSVVGVTCEVLGVIALVLGVLLGYGTRSVFNSRAFSERVAASLSEPGVSAYVAGKIADGVLAAKPDLTGLRPLIVAGSRSVVSSAPFRVAAQRAALEVHHALMSGTGEKIILSVHDVGEILQATLAMRPDLAARLPARVSARIASLDDLPAGVLAARLVRIAHRARLSVLMLLIGGLVLLGFGVGLSRDHRRALFQIGIAVAAVACLIWLVARFGGGVVGALPRNRDIGQLAAGLWQAFVGDLRVWALALGLVGVVFAAASASLLERTQIEALMRTVWRWLATGPEERGMQFLRGVVVLLLGAIAAAWPLPALSVLALLAGAVAVFIGLRECFVAALQTIPEVEESLEKSARHRARRGARSPVLVTAASTLVLAIVAAVAIWIARSPSGAPETTAITACNGYPELCDRRLDQVVFPASHNSMGGADNPGWMFPNQNKSIPRQLEDGVRAFLIDAHYGMSVGDKVKTIMENEKIAMAKYEAAVGKEGMAAALRIRDRLVGGDERQRAVYMAHGFCELGATRLTETLGQIRDFLVANPGEILIIIIQDEGVSPQDIAKCFEASGLIDFVYRGPVQPPWPTLREMAESDQRVVVMAENNSAGVPWYHQAFEVCQETPYTFHNPSQFSEKSNRGGTKGSLLLLNHWIESTPMPKPSNAAVVNAYDFLLRRARRCQQARGRLPNLVAVDFYATGDLMRVVQALNGVRP